MSTSVSDGFRQPLGVGNYTEDSGDRDGYRVDQDFNEYNASYGYHLGEDWNGDGGGNSDEGDPIYAASNGQITQSGRIASFGNYVTIRHDLPHTITVTDESTGHTVTTNEVVTLYAHLRDTPLVQEGDVVSKGQQIGYLGNTGVSDSAHLHFEVRLGTQYHDIGGYEAGGVPSGWTDPTTFINGHRILQAFPATGSDDLLTGDDSANSVYALAGNDTVVGLGGDDTLRGGDGADLLSGGNGSDLIYGNKGADTLIGHSGSDTLYGGQETDRITGGDADDVLYGNLASDLLSGGGGGDTLYGGQGADTLFGGGNDNTLYGNLGDDVLYAGSGSALLLGGDGNDTIHAGTGSGSDTAIGGDGADTFVIPAPGNSSTGFSVSDLSAEDRYDLNGQSVSSVEAFGSGSRVNLLAGGWIRIDGFSPDQVSYDSGFIWFG